MSNLYQKRHNSRSRLARIFINAAGVLFSKRHKISPEKQASCFQHLFLLFSEFSAEFSAELPDKNRWLEIEQQFSDIINID